MEYETNVARFGQVTAVTLWLPYNFTENHEYSRVDYLKFVGSVAGQARAGIVQTVYESQANLKDHRVRGDYESHGSALGM